MSSCRTTLVLLTLSALLMLVTGCASRQAETTSVEEPAGIERPAEPLEEETTLSDQIGEVGIVLLVVAVTIGGILIPLLLF